MSDAGEAPLLQIQTDAGGVKVMHATARPSNSSYSSSSSSLHLGQIYFIIWTNTFYNVDKYILQFGQIHFTIWTNTFYNLDKIITV